MDRDFSCDQSKGRFLLTDFQPSTSQPGGASIMDDIIPTPHLYPAYRERDAIFYSSRTGLVGLGAGLFAACMKNVYFGSSARAITVFTTYGSTIPIYGTSIAVNRIDVRKGIWSVWIY